MMLISCHNHMQMMFSYFPIYQWNISKLVLYSLIGNVNYSYEAMAMMGSATNVKYTDLSNMIDEICQRYVIF